MNRTRKLFTDIEIKALASNPYTLHVTPGQITFTKAFKELFWERYSKGVSPWEIFPDCGYDIHILGDKRIEGIRYSIKKEFMDHGGFYNGKRPPVLKTATHEQSLSPEKKVRQLEEKVTYLEQQMEFLKKIISSRTTRK